MKLPDKKYQIILADVAWDFTDKALAGNRGACCKYDVMKINEVKSLPIWTIADQNCFLFMWGSWALLPQCLDVIKAWGFEYKTLGFLWTKKNKTKGGFKIGMGNYVRANSEYCLMAVRGKPKVISHKVTQIIDTPVRKHSQKPDIVRSKIIQLCGDLPRIELFARTKVHGWDVIGNDEKLQNEPLEAYL